jgi:hypothetical protein
VTFLKATTRRVGEISGARQLNQRSHSDHIPLGRVVFFSLERTFLSRIGSIWIFPRFGTVHAAAGRSICCCPAAWNHVGAVLISRTDRFSLAAISSGRMFASAIFRKRSFSDAVHRLFRVSTMQYLFTLRLHPQLHKSAAGLKRKPSGLPNRSARAPGAQPAFRRATVVM